ncbi:MAG: Anti-sigma F factor antagonist [Pelotomaculum sp. PtaU1.Bin035]|nr:MAG: Anti-sigma F factor antagonist [Pelotomaculum sp. PtaU1.Bin035]
MRLDLELIQDTLIVRLSGDLDLGVADYLRDVLEDSLDRQPVKNLVFNLAGVSFVDSSVLGVLLGRYKRISRNGGKVCVVKPQPQVHRILELSGLLRIMAEFPGETDALENIG